MAKYINKSTIVAEIEERINKEIQRCAVDLGYSQGRVDSMRNILSYINSLEVKEVVAEQEGICNGMFNRIIGDTWNLVIPLDKVGLKHGDKVKIFITKEE